MPKFSPLLMDAADEIDGKSVAWRCTVRRLPETRTGCASGYAQTTLTGRAIGLTASVTVVNTTIVAP